MREETIQKITAAQEPVYVRSGFGWKGAEWHKTTKEKLIAAVNAGNYAHYDICTINGGLGINFYSANDMW